MRFFSHTGDELADGVQFVAYNGGRLTDELMRVCSTHESNIRHVLDEGPVLMDIAEIRQYHGGQKDGRLTVKHGSRECKIQVHNGRFCVTELFSRLYDGSRVRATDSLVFENGAIGLIDHVWQRLLMTHSGLSNHQMMRLHETCNALSTLRCDHVGREQVDMGCDQCRFR